MKTFDLGKGERGKGGKGEEKSSPSHPLTLSPSLFERSGKLQGYWRIMLLALALGLAGCAFYSFTAATIPQRFDTIAVPLVVDGSTNPFTQLGPGLTDLLVDRFVRQTRLQLETSEDAADVVLTGRIEQYRNVPAAVGEEGATLNRVSISVIVQYYDQVEDEALFQRSFSSSEQYDPVQDGPEGERAAAFAALENIADNVFSEATSDW